MSRPAARWTLLLALALVTGTAGAADSSLIVQTKQLTLDAAYRIAHASLKACRDKGVQVAVTVVDRAGNPQVVLRDTFAPDLTLAVSRRKAYTAAEFGVATSKLQDRFKGAYSIGKLDQLMLAPGAVPIEAGGTRLGAVGVSGAPSGQTDEACARAGVKAVQTDLDMSGF